MQSFTINQKKALDTQRHMIVSANAGSGKTVVFVQRYVDLITREVDPVPIRNIVAITFTEKAAGELKKKVSARIEELTENAASKDKVRYDKLREQLVAANIFTIHAFCRKILTDFTIESGLDPAFTIITGTELTQLTDRITKQTLEDILTPLHQHPQYQPLMRVIESMGRRSTFSLIEAIRDKREIFHALFRTENALYQQDEKEILDRWFSALSSYLKIFFTEPYPGDWLRLLLESSRHAQGEEVKKIVDLIDRIQKSSDMFEQLACFGRLMEVGLTDKKKLRVKEFKGQKVEHPLFAEVENEITPIAQAIEPFIGLTREQFDRDHEILIEHSKTLLRVIEEIYLHIDEEKNEQSVVDFTDLQIKVSHLLRDRNLREEISNEYRYIMVDEYQDTDALQYEIFLALTDSFSKNNFYAVGDDKQSIYQFRNAEVEIFSDTGKKIIAVQQGTLKPPGYTGEVIADDKLVISGKVVLPESFRLLKENAAFVNHVFRKLMVGKNPGGVEYIDFVSSVNESYPLPPGTVELLLAQHDDDENNSLAEEELIARKINRLLHEKKQIRDRHENRLRDVRFGDIAILMRSRNTLPAIEVCLRAHQIPFIVTGGIGFYATQELWDIYHYLRFMVLPADDVALFGLLRSPFFGLSDAELYRIAQSKDGRNKSSLWEKFQSSTSRRAEECAPESLRVIDVLLSDLALADRITVPMFVQHILHQPASPGWIGIVGGSHRGDQAIANIEKLIDLAHEFESRGLHSLYDFVEELEMFIRTESEEAEGTVSLQDDAVHLMTIHAAKGLEFPVVFLCNLDKQFKFTHTYHFDRQHGYFFDPIHKTKTDVATSIAMKHWAQAQSISRMVEEEKRVLYVAMTRAADCLFLCARIKKRGWRNSFAHWFTDVLHIDPQAFQSSYSMEETLTIRKVAGANEEYSQENMRVTLPVITAIDKTQINREADHVVPRNNILHLESIPVTHESVTRTASQVLNFKSCKRKYYLRYCLGVHDQHTLETESEYHTDEPGFVKTDIGMRTHEILSAILNTNDADRVIKNWETVASGTHESDIVAALQHAHAFIDSDFGIKVLERGLNPESSMQTEIQLHATLGDDFLLGTLDRLYKNQEDHWSLIDYKTNTPGVRSIDDLVEHYQAQMDFYAYLVWRAKNNPAVIDGYFFFTESGVEKKIQYRGDEMERRGEALRGMTQEMGRMKHSINIPAANYNHCQWCLYYNHGAEKCIFEVT